MLKKTLYLFLSLLFLIDLIGCGKKPIIPRSELDTPEYHCALGRDCLERGEYKEAISSFARAKGLDPKYPPAYEGLGLAYLGMEKLDLAKDNMQRAKSLDPEYVPAYIGMGRIYTKMGKWEDAIYEYKDALDLDKTCVEAYFWMGQTYISAGQFVQAEEALKKALEINPDHSKSYESLKELQKISRVAVGQDEYAKIATLPAIDRADLAALFIKELELEKLFKTYNVKVDVGFKPPTPPLELPREAEVSEAEPQISDIEGHWAKGYIEKIIELGVMKPFPDQTFQPDQPITRATFALLIQDILSKIYHDDKLCTRHVGQESPFPDVRPDHWAFNAIMIVTTRGIMKAGLDGMFNMMDPVSGADALESLKILKSTLEK